METLFQVFVFSLIFHITYSFVELSDRYPKCHQIQKDNQIPKFEKCVVQAALDWKPILLDGIPELDFPSITKLVIPKAEVQQKARAFAFDATFINTTVRGLELYQFDLFRYDLKSHTYHAIMRFPKLNADGIYKVKGRFLGEKITRQGEFNATVENTLVNFKLFTKIVKRKGTTFLKITDNEIDIKIGRAYGDFGKLFGEVEFLNKAVTQFLKDSTGEVFEAVKPDVISTLKKLVASTLNSLTDNIPFDSIFPPDGKENVTD